MPVKGWIPKEQSVWEVYNGQIKELRNQGLTLQSIGDRVGVTRERVRQILAEHYGTTATTTVARSRLAKLLGCSEGLLTRLEKQGTLNPTHSGSLHLYNRDESEKAALAVAQVQQEEHRVTLVCDECGKVFERRRGEVAYQTRKGRKHWFCSRQCLGKHAGRGYGFAVHHENIRTRKWDWEEVRKLREETGWSNLRIGEALGIPESTVGRILVKLFGKPLPRVKRLKTPVQHRPPPVEKECIGCGAIHTRRSLFCSIKCRDRIRSLVRYYEGQHLGGRGRGRKKKVKVHCSVCGTEVERHDSHHRHYCDRCLREYRGQVGQRLKVRG